jgi:hypothetical protein
MFHILGDVGGVIGHSFEVMRVLFLVKGVDVRRHHPG